MKKMMNDYEIDSMWMSYRYCIGRHTISALTRAHDIAVNCYKRMTNERSIFSAYDIRKYCNDLLRLDFDFYCSDDNKCFEVFAEAINKLDLPNDGEKIPCSRIFYVNNEFKKDESGSSKYFIKSNYEDLIEWQYLAGLFDLDNHFIVKTKEGDIECFNVWIPDKFNKEKYKIVKKIIPVDMYLKRGSIVSLNENFIIK